MGVYVRVCVWMRIIECVYGHGCVCGVMCMCVLGVGPWGG